MTDEQALEPLSKTRRKQQMQDLQDLGEELAGLSAERLKKIDIPEQLRDALHAAERQSADVVGRGLVPRRSVNGRPDRRTRPAK